MNILKRIISIIIYIIIIAVLIIGILFVTEYSPKSFEELKVIGSSSKELKEKQEVTLLTFNLCGLVGESKEESEKKESEEIIHSNLEKVQNLIAENKPDVVLLQDVDYKSSRSDNVNEYTEIAKIYEGTSSFATRYKTIFPYESQDTLGKIYSGQSILSKFECESYRISLPVKYRFPLRIFFPRQCMQKQIFKITDSDKALVVINIDLEYEDEEIRLKQLDYLKREILADYEKGNYVVVGGSFNMPLTVEEKSEALNVSQYLELENWNYGIDKEDETFTDGYIISPNIQIDKIEEIMCDCDIDNHKALSIKIKLK